MDPPIEVTGDAAITTAPASEDGGTPVSVDGGAAPPSTPAPVVLVVDWLCG
jgi:hypothetical protein